MNSHAESEDEWTLWWDARLAAMESVLGKSHDTVGHGTIPFHLGADLGGTADIVYFHNHVDGIVSVTAELIGNADQAPNSMGNYELAICSRDDDDWGANIIGQLAHYTLETVLEPGQTMDIGPATPDGSSITAFLFCDYGRFTVRDQNAGLILCIGITAPELNACRDGNRDRVEELLTLSGVFPFTDLHRRSVV
ncbi:Suppressor of fused protein (SUFU) [Posidoniimonas polymericola]|uniref:Suppressor of fused protein (SUFU) n=1 Tax=Posidoniimonas polymericola TaxID=2528002 RepID=A0A5C5YH35_9BACT|nr:suppressor of fused domain protein [Posidoniimonas polymericola]TWT74419.1 Suppressor of fused protein (SUFU) [Posidoniimonas polymericola]